MKIDNEQHVTLHPDALTVLEQAEKAGWDRAWVFTQGWKETDVNYYRWPMIALYSGQYPDTLSIHISTTPNYVTQHVYHVAEIQYNHPILTPASVESLTTLVKGVPQ